MALNCLAKTVCSKSTESTSQICRHNAELWLNLIYLEIIPILGLYLNIEECLKKFKLMTLSQKLCHKKSNKSRRLRKSSLLSLLSIQHFNVQSLKTQTRMPPTLKDTCSSSIIWEHNSESQHFFQRFRAV